MTAQSRALQIVPYTRRLNTVKKAVSRTNGSLARYASCVPTTFTIYATHLSSVHEQQHTRKDPWIRILDKPKSRSFSLYSTVTTHYAQKISKRSHWTQGTMHLSIPIMILPSATITAQPYPTWSCIIPGMVNATISGSLIGSPSGSTLLTVRHLQAHRQGQRSPRSMTAVSSTRA
jgi:hypothetical protein